MAHTYAAGEGVPRPLWFLTNLARRHRDRLGQPPPAHPTAPGPSDPRRPSSQHPSRAEAARDGRPAGQPPRRPPPPVGRPLASPQPARRSPRALRSAVPGPPAPTTPRGGGSGHEKSRHADRLSGPRPPPPAGRAGQCTGEHGRRAGRGGSPRAPPPAAAALSPLPGPDPRAAAASSAGTTAGGAPRPPPGFAVSASPGPARQGHRTPPRPPSRGSHLRGPGLTATAHTRHPVGTRRRPTAAKP